MGESCIQIQGEGCHENPSKTEKQSDGTNFLDWKRPGNDKIEYDAAHGLYKEGKGNNGNAPN